MIGSVERISKVLVVGNPIDEAIRVPSTDERLSRGV